jgi:hypothetical protein
MKLMDTQSRAATQLLETLSFVNTLREVTGGVKIIQALLETSSKEWDNSKDANTDTHLIQGVAVSTKKSDAVHVYIAKIVAQHMRSVGNRQTAWTKGTIASEHHTNVAITNRIAAGDFQTHVDLFKIVAGRLLGYDDGLFDFALAETPRDKAETLVAYMATRFDLSDDRNCALSDYPNAIDFAEMMFEKDGFNNEYFLKTIGQVISYFANPTNDAGSHLTDPFDVIDMLATESDFDSLTSATTLLGVTVHTIILDKHDLDPEATVAELRKVYGDVKFIAPNGVLDLNSDEAPVVQVGVVDAHREASLTVKRIDEIVPASTVKIDAALKGEETVLGFDHRNGDYKLAGDGKSVSGEAPFRTVTADYPEEAEKPVE